MDYSSDECYVSFTKGQIDRMYYVWSLYRRKGEICGVGAVMFELTVFLTDGGGGVHNSFELTSEDKMVDWTGGNESLSLIDVTFRDNAVNQMDLCIDSTKNYEFVLYDTAANGLGVGGILRSESEWDKHSAAVTVPDRIAQRNDIVSRWRVAIRTGSILGSAQGADCAHLLYFRWQLM